MRFDAQSLSLQHRQSTRFGQRGLGLADTLMALFILAGLLSATLHWSGSMAQRHTIEAAAALLETDLRHARALALAMDAPVRFELVTDGEQPACYITHTGAAGSCRCQSGAPAICQPGVRVLRAVNLPADGPVRIQHGGRALTFHPGKGTVTPTATFVVQGGDGGSIRQVINIMGRVRSCSDERLAGLRPCT